MSANVSEETRRSPRSIHKKKRSVERSLSPRAIQHHPSLLLHPPRHDHPPIHYNDDPTDQLWNLLRQRDWQGALYRLHHHPRDAAWTDHHRGSSGSGSTCLHVACTYRAPVAVLQAVTRAWPAALWTPDAAGWIPLHVLLLHGTEEAGLSFVMGAGGRAAATFVSSQGDHRNSSSSNNNSNNWTTAGTSLHLACRHGVSVAVLLELLHLTGADTVRQSVPCFPADLVWKQMERAARGRPPEQSDVELLQRWNLLVAAARGRPLTGTNDDRFVLLGDPHHALFTLQQVLEFHYSCTSGTNDFVQVYLRLYPEAASLVDITNGRLPLHVACALSKGNNNNNNTTDSTFQAVLQAHPAAARTPDASGHLPLHVALSRRPTQPKLGAKLLQQLVEAHPAALERRCPVTRLLPFQLAASSACSEDSVYDLLRACPQLVETIKSTK